MIYLESFDQKFGEVVMNGIPNNRFWEFVDRSGWKEYCSISFGKSISKEDRPYNIDNVLENIAPYFPFEELKGFRKMYDTLYKKLEEKLGEHSIDPGFGVSDDGYSDLLSSIIGLGKKFCGDILSSADEVSFKKVQNMVNRENYSENFVYIFSSKEDREGVLSEWDRIYKANHFDKNKESFILNYVNSNETERFWEFVDHTNWAHTSHEYFNYGKDYVLENIAPYFSHDEFKKFRKIYKTLDKYLIMRLKYMTLNAEEEAYWDLRSSIIGYGKDVYVQVIEGNNNNEYVKRMDYDNDYYENFGYIFVYDDFDITVPEEDCKEEWDIIYNNKNNK